MTTVQYFSTKLMLHKGFLMKTHAHRLVTEVQNANPEFLNNWWQKDDDLIAFDFGGVLGSQFTSEVQLEDFLKCFKDLLVRKSIPQEHLPSLLYFISFYEKGFQDESSKSYQANRLFDSADFLTDLLINGVYHFKGMLKNNEYSLITDPVSNAPFFAKNHLIKEVRPEELIDYIPSLKNKNDLVRYVRIKIGRHKIYVPEETFPALFNNETLKSIEGETIDYLIVPKQFKRPLLQYLVDSMMKEHEEAETDFYKIFQEAELDLKTLKDLYRGYRKFKISNVKALKRLGIIISEFLLKNKLLKTKRDIAGFLWEYFSLFKLFQVKHPTQTPSIYSDLTRFYIEQGNTKESVRLMMKDVRTVGDF